MRELLNGRRHLLRVRFAALLLALLGVALAPRFSAPGLAAGWALAALGGQGLLWAFERLVSPIAHRRLMVALDLALFASASALSGADLFWLLLFPVILAVWSLGPWDITLTVAGAVGLHALSLPSSLPGAEDLTRALLRAAALAVAGAGVWAVARSARGARPRWSAVRDAAASPHGRGTIAQLRGLTETIGGLLDARRSLLYVLHADGSLTFHDPLMSLSDAQCDAAGSLAASELLRSASRAHRAAVIPDPSRDPRLPLDFVRGLRPSDLLVLPVQGAGDARGVVVLVDKNSGDPFSDEDAGLGMLVAALACRAAEAASEAPSECPPVTDEEPPGPDGALAFLPDLAIQPMLVLGAQGVLVSANGAARSLMGLPDDAVGRPLTEAIRSDELRSFLSQGLHGTERQVGHWTAPDGARVAVQLTPLLAEEAHLGAVVSLSVDPLATDTRAVCDRVLSAVSHELRTPLTAIRAATSTLLRAPTLDPSTREQLLQESLAQADRLQAAIDELIDAAEPGSTGPDGGGPADTDEALAPLSEVVRRVVADQERATPGRRAETSLEESEAVAAAPADEVERLVSRLLRDAWTRSEPGTPIRVATASSGDTLTLSVSFRADPRLCRVAAESSEPFAVAGAGPRPGGGLGLGLFLAKQSAERLGGSLLVGADAERVEWNVTLPRRAS